MSLVCTFTSIVHDMQATSNNKGLVCVCQCLDVIFFICVQKLNAVVLQPGMQYVRVPNTVRRAEAESWSISVLTVHVYVPSSASLMLAMVSDSSSFLSLVDKGTGKSLRNIHHLYDDGFRPITIVTNAFNNKGKSFQKHILLKKN